jgi:hypothetical protein
MVVSALHGDGFVQRWMVGMLDRGLTVSEATEPLAWGAHPFEIRPGRHGAEVWVRLYTGRSLTASQAWVSAELEGVEWQANDEGTFHRAREERPT